jgi:hypothetical protein
MNWFSLPAQCIFDKEIPLSTLLKQIGNKSEGFINQITSEIDFFHLYACIKDVIYPIDCLAQKDSYLNEILFLRIKLKNHINIDLLTKKHIKSV